VTVKAPVLSAPAADVTLHSGFLALLPRIRRRAEIAFHFLRCPAERADCVADAVALAWAWYRRLAQRGKDAANFAAALATFAARAVKAGRRVAGSESAKDVLSVTAKLRHGVKVLRLPERVDRANPGWREALAGNVRTPPDEQAAFRLDFPAWLATRTDRDRRLIADLAVGERAGDVARKFGLSAARVSQLRQEYCVDWSRFCGEAVQA
jgi:hypothetical protein